jgi:hypothetical protein
MINLFCWHNTTQIQVVPLSDFYTALGIFLDCLSHSCVVILSNAEVLLPGTKSKGRLKISVI